LRKTNAEVRQKDRAVNLCGVILIFVCLDSNCRTWLLQVLTCGTWISGDLVLCMWDVLHETGHYSTVCDCLHCFMTLRQFRGLRGLALLEIVVQISADGAGSWSLFAIDLLATNNHIYGTENISRLRTLLIQVAWKSNNPNFEQ
jgi:hypothetical protein